MLVNSARTHSFNGIQLGMQRIGRNAEEIARACIHDGADVTKPLVELQCNRLHTEGSVRKM